MLPIRLPSLGAVVSAAWRSAQRFPLVLAAGALTAIAGILVVHTEGDDKSLIRLLLATSLGLPLNFGLAVAAERRTHTRAGYWLVATSGVLILAAFWYAWPRWTEPQQAMRFAQFAAAVHLFVAVAPFVGVNEPRAFWQYNRILFLRFLIATLYAAVLWIGLSGALVALDQLFGADIPEEGYLRLWMVMTFVFHPWFFVAGVPEDVGALESETHYPRGLRVFTQYVLVPIVVIYLLILTIYLAKVVVTREWPSGWIGFLVSGVAGVGILSWLLVHPLEERAEHAWVKTFTRGFYIALMPAIVMLWLAIWKRVDQYGITERRYFLTVLSLWLAGIAIYYTFLRSRSIKVIPATLCALAVLTFAGPWGAYSVSRWSQTRRLDAIFTRNEMLAQGTLHPAPRAVSDSDATAIGSGLNYLIETHGRASVDRWMSDSLRARVATIRGGNVGDADAAARAIMRGIDLPVVAARRRGGPGMFSYGVRRPSRALKIDGYSYAVDFSLSNRVDSVSITDDVAVRMSGDSTALLVTNGGAPVLTVPLVPLVDSLARFQGRSWQVPERYMLMEYHSGAGAALIRLTTIAGVDRIPRRVTSLSGDLYLRLP